MAGSIPPLVSSSPPPLCAFDDEEEDDDDEFGMYAAAEELHYNGCLSFNDKDGEKLSDDKSRHGGEQDSTSQDSATDSGLCPDSEGFSPTLHSDDERIVKQSTCGRVCQKSAVTNRLASNCDSDSSECLDQITVTHTALPNGLDDHSNLPESNNDVGYCKNIEFPSASSLVLADQEKVSTALSLSPEKEINGVVLQEESLSEEQPDKDFQNQTLELNTSTEEQSINSLEFNLDPKDSFSCEFSVFEQQDISDGEAKQAESIVNGVTTGTTVHSEQNNAQLESGEDDEFDGFTDFKANFSISLDLPEVEQSDKLSEHSKPFSEQELSEEAVKSWQLPNQDESDDEFSNFADFSSSDCQFVSAQSSNSLENVSHIPLKPSDDTDLRTDSEFQDWVSVFPSVQGDQPPCENGDIDLLKQDDVVWTRLFPLESSPAFSYHWADSLANRCLLSALNIDSRNILFMPWSNSSVPRFAANLSCGPLEPVKATEPLQPLPIPASTQEIVPDAHFDWVSSGLTNPLDCPKPVLIMPKTIGAEAENILSSLPDLSFMRKTYIYFPITKG